MTARVYRELRTRAETLLGLWEPVVLDASWTDAGQRGLAEALATETSADLVRIRCVAPDSVAAARMRRRPPSPSDADPEVAAAMAREADPWPEATAVATDVPLAESRLAAETAWWGAPQPVAQS
jgi:hypothetical protein